MTEIDVPANPLDQFLDYCVYAPLGFALEARSLLPRFVDRGRGQIVLARVVGKYAVKRGNTAAEGMLVNAAERAVGTLRLIGLVPGDATDPLAVEVHEAAPSGSEAPPTVEPPMRATRPMSEIDPATLAIPDYDSLSASQVVPRLASLSVEELQAVRDYEQASRGRKTILNRIAQLQSG